MNYILVVIIFCFYACFGCIKPRYNPVFIKNLVNESTNFNELVGEEYKIIKSRIKQGKVHYLVTKYDSTFLIGIDLIQKKIDFKIPSPYQDYVFTEFDASYDSIYVFNSSIKTELYIISILTKTKRVISIDLEKIQGPSEITQFKNQIYFNKAVYGSTVYNIFLNDYLRFLNVGEQTSKFKFKTLSFPLNSNINLLSGQMLSRTDMVLNAIDSSNKIHWQYNVEIDSFTQHVSMSTFNTRFLVLTNNRLISLSIDSGKLEWEKEIAGRPLRLLKNNDRCLVVLLSPVNPESVDKLRYYQIEFRLITPNNGNVMWSAIYNIYLGLEDPNIAIVNDKILFSDRKKIRVIDFNTGNLLTENNKRLTNYFFMPLMDLQTGNNYISDSNGNIYW